MILINYENNEYYLAMPITNIQVGEYVYVSGYNTFGDITGYANVKHNLIRIQTSSSVISISQTMFILYWVQQRVGLNTF